MSRRTFPRCQLCLGNCKFPTCRSYCDAFCELGTALLSGGDVTFSFASQGISRTSLAEVVRESSQPKPTAATEAPALSDEHAVELPSARSDLGGLRDLDQTLFVKCQHSVAGQEAHTSLSKSRRRKLIVVEHLEDLLLGL